VPTRLLREADVEIETGADPERPNRSATRARRSDPVHALKKAGTIGHREIDAVERLRGDMEAADARMPVGTITGARVQGHMRLGVTDRELNATRAVRQALAHVSPLNHAEVVWVSCGGSLSGLERFAGTRHELAASRLRAGLGELADFYYGPVGGDHGPIRSVVSRAAE
jgi:hypothetical protein